MATRSAAVLKYEIDRKICSGWDSRWARFGDLAESVVCRIAVPYLVGFVLDRRGVTGYLYSGASDLVRCGLEDLVGGRTG